MDKIKVLQEKYRKGELTKAQYLSELAKLVESKDISQDEMDDATDFNPEADKPIYTQADVDGMIARKATQQLRKILKDAGVEVDATNKDLPAKVVDMVKIGAGKMAVPEGAEVDALKSKAGKVETLTAEMKTLRMENAVLKTIGKYKPVSPTAVIALMKSDYSSLIDYLDEETGEIDVKSVDRAFKRMQLDEPTLFASEDEGNKGDKGGNFRGKGPGGAGAAAGDDKGHDANKARALEIMGLNKKADTSTK